jgi:integrase
MKGCTFKRRLRSGRTVWGFSVDAGPDDNGRRTRVFKSGFKLERDAEAALLRVRQQLEQGLAAPPDPRTLTEFMDQWFEEYATPNCSPKTVERYRELAKKVTQQLGPVQLEKITPLQLQRVYNQLLNSPAKTGRPPSVKTVRHVHGLIHVAFETAVKWRILKSNPSDACTLPPVPEREAQVLDYDQTAMFIEACQDHWMGDLIFVAAATGARRGELLALRWPDVDLSNGVLTIRSSLEQTKKSEMRFKETKGRQIRRIALKGEIIEVLQRIHTKQEEWRGLFGADYRADLDLVFCHPDGNWIRPDVVTKGARRLARKAGLKGVSLHTMRHSHGSQLLSLGVPLPTVSKRLGHASVNVTATIYAHALPSDETEAAEIWAEAMKKTKQEQSDDKRKQFGVIDGKRRA